MTTFSTTFSLLSASASFNSSPPFSASSIPVSMSTFLSASSPLIHSSTNSSSKQCDIDDTLRVPLLVIYSFIFVFGLVGNIFALWVFLYFHSSRNSVRVFLINCAVADLVLLACLPFRIFYHINNNQWVLGSVACKLVGNLFYMNMYISITLLGLISLDRYLRLKGKGRARRGMVMWLWGHARPWSWVACGALWGLSLIGLVLMIATKEDKDMGDQCFQFKKRRKDGKGKAYFNGILVLMFWFVFIMLMASYAKIASQLLRASRDKPDLPNSQKYQRTAKKSFFVLFLFTVCFGPYHLFRPVYIFTQLSDTASCEYQTVVDHTNEVMLLFSAFNSCLDPVMYFLLSGSVRKTALKALGHRFMPQTLFLHDATSNSSMTELRRSMPVNLLNPELNTPLGTPRTSIFVINSTLRRTGQINLPPNDQE